MDHRVAQVLRRITNKVNICNMPPPDDTNPSALFLISSHFAIMGNIKSKSKTKASSQLKQTTTSTVSKDSSTRILADREYHNVEKSSYVLPKDDQEKDRLHEVNAISFQVPLHCSITQ
jgi:hypothetical protein